MKLGHSETNIARLRNKRNSHDSRSNDEGRKTTDRGAMRAARSLFLHSSSGNVLLFLAQDYSKANQYSSQQTQQRRNPLGMWGADSAMTDPHSVGRDAKKSYAQLATSEAITCADARFFFPVYLTYFYLKIKNLRN